TCFPEFASIFHVPGSRKNSRHHRRQFVIALIWRRRAKTPEVADESQRRRRGRGGQRGKHPEQLQTRSIYQNNQSRVSFRISGSPAGTPGEPKARNCTQRSSLRSTLTTCTPNAHGKVCRLRKSPEAICASRDIAHSDY